MAKSQASKHGGSASSECTTSYKETVIYTTYIETESNGFKDVVQKLTGVSEGEKLPVTMPARKPGRGRAAGGIKPDISCCALMEGGIEVGAHKSPLKLHPRKEFHKTMEIKLDLNHDTTSMLSSGNHGVLFQSPITSLGHADPFVSSSSHCCFSSSTPNSCNESSYLEEVNEFGFEGPLIRLKREPELLPLFPLHSPMHPTNT
ncbi:hypothetical protein SUGI_0324630 [Cryptomeria japonica]|uniref:VQ motif-containing protein 11 n=1 Tax=Cryptomeria japonica TaxID=3369 RepID=UPI002408E596|nr:VQ motif-containing protein 11 [Cryptomeria japonica]GLJ18340.1 hypothetical protein SUGI_0324630 [Cryptomeria japonica]